MPSVGSLSSRILLVETDADMRDVLTEILERAGYEVVQSHRTEEASSVLQAAPSPALVLLDLQFPTESGEKFLERVRAQWDPGRLPVIILTATRIAKVPGAQAVLNKPFEIDELLRTIKTLISRD